MRRRGVDCDHQVSAFERRRRFAKPLQAGCPVRIVRQMPGCVGGIGTELQAAPVDVGAAQQGGEGREGQGAMRIVRMVRIAGPAQPYSASALDRRGPPCAVGRAQIRGLAGHRIVRCSTLINGAWPSICGGVSPGDRTVGVSAKVSNSAVSFGWHCSKTVAPRACSSGA